MKDEEEVEEDQDEMSDPEVDTSPKKKDKKLVFLSRSVLKCVRENPMTTGTEIANEILELYRAFSDKVEFKNVQRRVYDALNVLSAMNVIYKHKNNIMYNEANTFIDDEILPNTVPLKGPSATPNKSNKLTREAKFERKNRERQTLN